MQQKLLEQFKRNINVLSLCTAWFKIKKMITFL